jgi:hypothetical protein
VPAASSSSSSSGRLPRHSVRPAAAKAGANATAPAAPLKFFGVGGAYHHVPVCPPGHPMPGAGCDAGPCPVPWEWHGNRATADAGGTPIPRRRPAPAFAPHLLETESQRVRTSQPLLPAHEFSPSSELRTPLHSHHSHDVIPPL